MIYYKNVLQKWNKLGICWRGKLKVEFEEEEEHGLEGSSERGQGAV